MLTRLLCQSCSTRLRVWRTHRRNARPNNERIPTRLSSSTRSSPPRSSPTMEHGTQCHLSTCLSLTFLPLACPFCRHDFCESHFLPTQHLCSAPGSANYNRVLSETELLKRILKVNDGQQQAGASGAPGGRRRLPCQKSGCKRFSLEVEREGEDVDSALGGSGAGNRPEVMVKNAESVKVFRHRAPTCPRCHALFCVR